jgi:hypothetical protein
VGNWFSPDLAPGLEGRGGLIDVIECISARLSPGVIVIREVARVLETDKGARQRLQVRDASRVLAVEFGMDDYFRRFFHFAVLEAAGQAHPLNVPFPVACRFPDQQVEKRVIGR